MTPHTIEIEHALGAYVITIHEIEYHPGEDATHDCPGEDEGAYYEVSYYYEDHDGVVSGHGCDPCDLPVRVLDTLERRATEIAREAACAW